MERIQKIFEIGAGTAESFEKKPSGGIFTRNLIALKKKAHRIGENADAFGYKDAGDLCQDLEWELISREKNFYLESPPPEWFGSLEVYERNIEAAFISKDKEEMEQSFTSKGKEKKTIVVVDDDPDIIKLLEYEFTELGFEVKSFQNGLNAINYLFQNGAMKEVNLLILDRILPDMDGLDILRKIAKEIPQHCPVLILSALGSEGDIISGLQVGAVDYVSKPFSIFLLMQKSLNLLKS